MTVLHADECATVAVYDDGGVRQRVHEGDRAGVRWCGCATTVVYDGRSTTTAVRDDDDSDVPQRR